MYDHIGGTCLGCITWVVSDARLSRHEVTHIY